VSALRARAEEYLAMRRALGFRLTTQGRHLMSFVRFCEERSADRVTSDLALEWATRVTRGTGNEVYQARKLDTVRIFARHLQVLDPSAEIPAADILSRRYLRIPPYLYSPQEITALMAAAGALRPAQRAATWQAFIGLISVTGMRQGEACSLGRDDIDLDSGAIVIRDSKFGKSRMVFLHPTATAALRAYERIRDQAFPEAGTFLVNTRGKPLDRLNVQHTFAALVTAAGITAPPGRRAPRLHDLRHVLAVETLMDWYRDGGNIQARLPVLSTWLGHIDPKSTYWYLQQIPELLALAAGRLGPHDEEEEEAS
jgi:integrase/recombinase XerD